jgi:hypothetical protein
MLVVLVGTVTTAAIIRYDVDSALKVWAALGSVIGVLTGAFVTYFFTRGALEAQKKNTALAEKHAADAEREAAAARSLADDRLAGLAKAAGLLPRRVWAATLAADPVLARALKAA